MLPQQREHGGHLGIVSLPFFGVPYLLPVDQKHQLVVAFLHLFVVVPQKKHQCPLGAFLTFKKIVLSIKIYRKDV